MVKHDLILKEMNSSLQYKTNAKIICALVSAVLTTVVLLMVYEYCAWSPTYDA